MEYTHTHHKHYHHNHLDTLETFIDQTEVDKVDVMRKEDEKNDNLFFVGPECVEIAFEPVFVAHITMMMIM